MNDKLKNLRQYIFPAMGGLFVTYLYNVVDGKFVGQGVGSAALGAMNIGVPFITFAVAVAATFPMGGATVVAIRMGRGDKEGANHAFMISVALTLLVSLLLTAVIVRFFALVILPQMQIWLTGNYLQIANVRDQGVIAQAPLTQ